MKEGRDLAVTLIASVLLLLGVSSLTQCSASQQRPSTANNAAAGSGQGVSTGGEAREDAAGTPKSAPEVDEDQDHDEREKIQRVGHALQTIGANPEMRKTLGIPP